jgi:hypothetical protein
MHRMKPVTVRFALAALALLLFGLVAAAQTPAELARQKKLARQGKAAPGAPAAPGTPAAAPVPGSPAAAAAKAPAAAPAPKGVVPPGVSPTSPLTRPTAGVVAPPPGAKPPGAPGAPGSPADPSVLPGGTPPPALGDIDQILEGEDEVLSGNGYSYDPGNRRDPFKSLLAAPDRQEFRGPRPEGVPGLLIDELDLTGIFKTGRGYVAQVKAPNQAKSYLLKEGDQLYDGDVVSISHKEVVFKQTVQDPTALKPFREVVKTLSP